MAAGDVTQGRRVPDGEWFSWQADGLIRPGDYGRHPVTYDGEEKWDWFNCPPDGTIGHLAINEPDRAGNFHTVTEHEDGTITVGGSVQVRPGEHVRVASEHISGAGPISSRDGWHGWLERGVWRES